MKTDHFYREYTKLVVPLLFQGMITTLVAMVDNLMVGQLGDHAIAAVAISAKVLGIMTFTLFSVSAAASVFIAQYFGAQNKQKQQEVFRISIILSIVVFLILASIFVSMPTHIIRFFVYDQQIETLAKDYLLTMLIGYIPFVLTINYSSALKVTGQVKMPLIASLCGVALNTVLNYMFIFGNFGVAPMGVTGAAIATVAARCLEFLLVFMFSYMNHYDFNTHLKDIFQVTPELTKEVVKKSLPLIVNEIIWSFGQATMLKLYGVRGSEVITAMSITETGSSIFYSAFQGLSAATPVLISQRLGADKLQEAYANGKEMLKAAIGLSLLLGAGMWSMSFVIPNLYQVSPVSYDLSVQMIRLVGSLFWVYFINTQCYFIMRAGGDMKSTLLMDGLFQWIVTIPVVAAVAYLTGLPVFMVYIIGQLCDVCKMIVSLYFFFKKRWVKNLTVTN